MLARQLAYITYVRGSMSTLQIRLFPYFYGFMPPTPSMEEPNLIALIYLRCGGRLIYLPGRAPLKVT